MSFPDTILKTKIYPPQMRSGVIRRSRLADLLDMGISQKLTLISAPAGFGKTTLLTAWLANQTLPSAWFSLDENDLSTWVSKSERISTCRAEKS